MQGWIDNAQPGLESGAVYLTSRSRCRFKNRLLACTSGIYPIETGPTLGEDGIRFMRLGKKRIRRILLVLGFCLAGVLGLWVLLPLWLPWLLRPIAHRVGVHYKSYTREGYRSFLIRGVDMTNGNIRVRADRVEVCVPTVWAWRHVVGTAASQRYVVIRDWRFD